jgi:hypothetical protein
MVGGSACIDPEGFPARDSIDRSVEVVGSTEPTRKIPGRANGKQSDRRVFTQARGQQTRDDFAQRAVASRDDDPLDSRAHTLPSDALGVARSAGALDVERTQRASQLRFE